MESRNPVLRRFREQEKSGEGFAYDEGRSACYAAAGAGRPRRLRPPSSCRASTTRPVPAPAGSPSTTSDQDRHQLRRPVIGAVIGWNLVEKMPLVVWGMASSASCWRWSTSSRSGLADPGAALRVRGGHLPGGISSGTTPRPGSGCNGIVQQAVIGTFVAFARHADALQDADHQGERHVRQMMMVALISLRRDRSTASVAALFGVGSGWGFYGPQHRHRAVTASRRRPRVVQPRARLRVDHAGDPLRRPRARVVAAGLRPARHAHLALPGDPAAAGDRVQQPLAPHERTRPRTDRCGASRRVRGWAQPSLRWARARSASCTTAVANPCERPCSSRSQLTFSSKRENAGPSSSARIQS